MRTVLHTRMNEDSEILDIKWAVVGFIEGQSNAGPYARDKEESF